MINLVDKYNSPGNLLLISSYPEKDSRYSKKTCAIGSFTKNLVENMKEQKIIILTTQLTKKAQIYKENNNLIIRFFKRNSIFSFLDLIYYLIKFNRLKKVLVQFEFASFGKTLTSGLFVFLPLINKIIGKETYFVFHQVITNTFHIEEYLGWRRNDIRNFLFTPAIRFFFLFISFFSKKIIVLEEEFKQRLIKIGVKNNKIKVIPHGVDNQLKAISKNLARKTLHLPLNKKIILYFGYLTWYKGADIFLRIAKSDKNKNNYYVIAGGPSFTQKQEKHYQNYLKQFSSLPKNCFISGFVPEDKIPLYYNAADIVLLPYRVMISSSGPLSLAFSFNKPILLSNSLKNYLKSYDFMLALKSSNLKVDEIFFSLKKIQQLMNLKISKNHLKKLIKFSSMMKKHRKFSVISNIYLSLLNKSGVFSG